MRLLSSYQRDRVLLISATLIGFLLFWWTGQVFRIPIHPGYEASLLQQPSPLLLIPIIAIVLAICTAIGTALASSIHYNAGLVVATLGLSALSLRGGTSRDILFWGLSHVGSPALFRTLFLETLILAILVAALGHLLTLLYSNEILLDRYSPLPPSDDPSLSKQAPTLLTQLALTAAGVLLLAPTEAKQQVLAAVALASFAGSAIAESFFPSSRRSWCFLIPLLVGLIGYAYAFLNPVGVLTGHLTGSLAPLARPLPLDYASAGPAAALLGHWMAQQSAHQRQHPQASPQNA